MVKFIFLVLRCLRRLDCLQRSLEFSLVVFVCLVFFFFFIVLTCQPARLLFIFQVRAKNSGRDDEKFPIQELRQSQNIFEACWKHSEPMDLYWCPLFYKYLSSFESLGIFLSCSTHLTIYTRRFPFSCFFFLSFSPSSNHVRHVFVIANLRFAREFPSMADAHPSYHFPLFTVFQQKTPITIIGTFANSKLRILSHEYL